MASTGNLSSKTGTCKCMDGYRSWVVEAWLSKNHDGDQDAQDQDDDRQQIDMVRQPRFLWGHCVCKEGRHEFIRRHRYRSGRGGAHRVGCCVLLLLALLD